MSYLPLWCCALAITSAAQPDPGPLAKIKQKALEDINVRADYVCAVRIERAVKGPDSHGKAEVDRARVETARVGDKVLLAWPGGDRMSGEDASRVAAGTLTSSDFTTQAKALFLSTRAVFHEAGEEPRGERTGLRYDFQVPVQASDWVLSVPGREVQIPYHGSFWVDKESLRLLALDLTADSVPPAIGFKSVRKILEYGQARIGSIDLLLPGHSALLTTTGEGEDWKNEARFEDCRAYTADAAGSPVAAVAARTLPDEFEVELSLQTEIDSDNASVGDPVSFRLEQTLKQKRETVAPKGSTVEARIAHLELVGGTRVMDFAFTRFVVDGGRVDITARNNEISIIDRYTTNDYLVGNSKVDPMAGKNVQTVSTRVEGPIRSNTPRLRMKRGFKLFLKSRSS